MPKDARKAEDAGEEVDRKKAKLEGGKQEEAAAFDPTFGAADKNGTAGDKGKESAADEEDETEAVFNELRAMFKEKHGRDATEEEVAIWKEQMQDAMGQGNSAGDDDEEDDEEDDDEEDDEEDEGDEEDEDKEEAEEAD